LLAEAGFASVYLRAIAARSELSVQSIYNIVGGREELLEAASAEWVIAIAGDAAERAVRLDYSRAFSIIQAYWRAPLVHRDYVQRTTQVSHSQQDPLTWPQLNAGAAVLDAELRRLKTQGALRGLVSPPSLAQQLIVLTHATIAGFVARPYALARFREELLSGPGCMLLGALQGTERDKLEHQLCVMPRW
jgi:AcrR family transcriptional regulator